jgi:hypothetical protein
MVTPSKGRTESDAYPVSGLNTGSKKITLHMVGWAAYYGIDGSLCAEIEAIFARPPGPWPLKTAPFFLLLPAISSTRDVLSNDQPQSADLHSYGENYEHFDDAPE